MNEVEELRSAVSKLLTEPLPKYSPRQPQFLFMRGLKSVREVEVGYHKKGFRKSIGKHHGKPRRFWLGHVGTRAKKLATELTRYHEFCQAMGMGEWVDEALDFANEIIADDRRLYDYQIKRARDLLTDAPSPGKAPASEIKPERKASYSPRQAISDYESHLELRAISSKGRSRKMTSMNLLRTAADKMGLSLDVEINSWGRSEIEKIIGYYISRPKTPYNEKMAVDTVATAIQHTREFFNWLDDGGKWNAPKNLHKLFKINRSALRTPAEVRKVASGKATFDIGELVKIYSKADERQRLYLLLSLNCGFWQSDISTLLRDDIQGDFIDRIRFKTRSSAVNGRWALWPELKRQIKQFVAGSGELAFVTEDGKPLVNDETDHDAIGQQWAKLLAVVNEQQPIVRSLPFGTLRKTAATAILRLANGNESVQQMMLCQSRQSVAGKHYTGKPDFTPLLEPLRKWGLELQAAGIPLGLV